MIEEYKLEFTRYSVNKVTGERVILDEPICVTRTFFSRGASTPIIQGQMLDEMKTLILSLLEGSESGWRDEPATEKQKKQIEEMHDYSMLPLPLFTGKTKGEAADYIDKYIKMAHEDFDDYERDGGGDE